MNPFESGSGDEYYHRLVDESSLRTYLQDHLGPASTFEVEHLKAGHSNETLFLTWGEHNLVLRRPPPGDIAEKAHDVLREYQVVDALQNTAVPVATTVLACDDHSVIGSDFYLMERERGDVIRDTEPERFALPSHRRQIGEELVDVLADIHAVDYEAVCLADFGHPKGFTERQVERWGKQLDWAFERTASEREVPLLERVGEWLADNVPNSYPHSLVHGDYKLDNVMFGPEAPPNLVSVFDWELSTLGDPLTDVGWMLAFWHDPNESEPPVPELMPTLMAEDGYPTGRDLVERYEKRSGITFSNERFYRTLAVYKLAALGEMFFARYLEGNSDDPLYPVMREGVPALADRAIDIVNGNAPL